MVALIGVAAGFMIPKETLGVELDKRLDSRRSSLS